MELSYKKILETIESNGFVAYIVGGYVRDFIMGIDSKDIDICTNATPKDLSKIFNNIKTYLDYGAVKLQINDSIVDITTFRHEIDYKDGKPAEIEYINSLEEDLKRRDFTINTLCMDMNENIVDLMNSKIDIESKVIKTVKDANISLNEDPSRILRAIRFMCTLDFELDDSILNYIINNKEEIRKINVIKRKEELDKLFRKGHVSKFLSFIKKYQLEDYIGVKSNNFKETDTVIGVWSQLDVSDKFVFTKQEKEQIKDIKELLNKSTIDEIDVYKKGVFICTVAGDILDISKNEVNLMYTNLPIKGIIDINILSEEICEVMNIKPGKELGDIIKYIEEKILDGSIKNDKSEIINELNKIK